MKILRMLAVLLSLAGLLCGCRVAGRPTADYRTRAFRAEIRWEREGVTVYAEAETAMTDGGPMLSSLRLIFASTVKCSGVIPETMAQYSFFIAPFCIMEERRAAE